MAEEKQYLTKEGYKKLLKELEDLKKKRKEIAKKLEEAIALGDLSENADYHKLKDEQALNESKIREINEILGKMEIIKTKKTGKIEIGSRFKVKDEKGITKEFTILGKKESDPIKGIISNESPLGKVFLGKKEGESVEFLQPNGIKKTFKILKIY